jgi:tetratricopeptide (TPR) repeat protein
LAIANTTEPRSSEFATDDRIGRLPFAGKVWDPTFPAIATAANRYQLFWGSWLIFTLVLAVYLPMLPGEFLIDDWRLIESDNPLVNGSLTPFNLWFQTDFTLSSFALWLQHLAWGHNPAGYHAVNLVLHAAGSILLWRLLVKLKVPGAWLAAALYAVHPVCVNSVARVAEIKNTLSLPFFLFSFWAYLKYEACALFSVGNGPAADPRARQTATVWYALALLSFVAALLSKTSTVMLPVVLLLCAFWQRGRIGRKDWVHAAPFFLLSLAFGLMSIWFQKNQALFSGGQVLPPSSFVQRLALAGNVITFYLGKAFWPAQLNLVYPQWKLDATALATWLPWFDLAALLAVCGRFYRKGGRHVLFALGCFGAALFPVMGLFDSQFLTQWQVSDHLQYLPLVAPVALAGAVVATLRKQHPQVFHVAVAVLLGLVSVAAFQRAAVFSTQEGLLRDAIARNPDASLAHNNLGAILAGKNEIPGAIRHFEAALRSDPGNASAELNLAQACVATGQLGGAERHFQCALQLKPFDVVTHKSYAELLRRQNRNRAALSHYLVALSFHPDNPTRLVAASLFYASGDAHQAITRFRQVLQLEPNNVEALNNLAWMLATCGVASERNALEAVRCAEKACALTGYKKAQMTGTLAAAYAESGRFSEAVTIGGTTVDLARNAGERNLASIGAQLLVLYRDGKPYHEKLAPGSL